jgi:outer membrane protein TolC
LHWKLAAVIVLAAAAPAQQGGLTLGGAVLDSIQRYPSIRVAQEQVNAAAAAIDLARTAYLPKIDALAQINRATRNNVFGLLLPQSVIPSMSGPVIGSNNLGSVWGSAIGGLVSWEPFDFGLRAANVATATASRDLSQAAQKRSEFEVAAAAADAYLTLAAARETLRAAQAAVERAESTVKITGAQADAGLRPGADRAHAEAELAAARTQVIQAQQAIDVAGATLTQFTGSDPAQAGLDEGGLKRLPPDETPSPLKPEANPVALEQNAVVEQARAQLRALERSYFPRFYLQAAAYARGTGAELNGDRLGGLNGLAPNYQNYALGFTVTFTISELAALRAREAAQSAAIRSQAARASQIAIDLRAQWNRAVAALHGARGVAANAPAQVTAAQAALQQATARYQSGLGNIEDVTESQRLLAQAEIDVALARLGVWRALLGIATAAGDLQPFIAEAAQ